MGQEIVYCYKCSSRIVVGESGKGASYSIGDRVACADCAASLLETLPPRERDELLARMAKTPQRGTRSPGKRTPSRGTESVAPPAASSRTPLILGAVGVGIVLILLIAAMSGGKPPRQPDPVPQPVERRTDPPKVAIPPPPVKESYDAELERIDASVAGVNRQEGFKEALDYLASARKRHDAAEWTLAVDQRIARTNAEIRTLYESLEAKAIDARRRGAETDVKEITDRVARWTLPDRAAALKKALETAAVYTFKQGADGLLCIEAEHYSAKTDASGHSWTVAKEPAGFEGDGAIGALPNTGANLMNDYAAKSPRLDFRVEFVKTGAHYVWVRAAANSDADNSLHLGLDGVAVPTLGQLTYSATRKFIWTNKQISGKNATVTVGTPGLHTIQLWMREDGAMIDRFVLTSDPKWTPKGNGPPESPR